MHKIKPFKNINTRQVLDELDMISPLIPSIPSARKGVRRACSQLKGRIVGIIDDEEVVEMLDDLAVLEAEAENAMVYAVAVTGYATAPLRDLIEYKAFSDVALPEKDTKPRRKRIVFSDPVNEALIRHTKAMEVLRQSVKSAPRYRCSGHDYFEDMIREVCRASMRPALGQMARAMEDHLGWTRLENTGILDHTKIKRHH